MTSQRIVSELVTVSADLLEQLQKETGVPCSFWNAPPHSDTDIFLSELVTASTTLLSRLQAESSRECFSGSVAAPGSCPCILCRAQDVINRARRTVNHE
jgi:hypothetical protein